MSEAGSRVKVTVRVRPPAGPSTRRGPAKECVEVDEGKRTLLLDEVGLGKSRELRFDSVHGPDTSQSEFFKSCGITDLLDAALDGYTSTVFAFGQTGSGKTFTMSGKAAETNNEQYGGRASAGHDRSLAEGLMQRTVRYLYAGLAKRTDVKYMVRATYLEIYNEQVVDLIEPAGPLAVRGSSSSGFYVEDLSVVQCRNVRDLQYVVAKGETVKQGQ